MLRMGDCPDFNKDIPPAIPPRTHYGGTAAHGYGLLGSYSGGYSGYPTSGTMYPGAALPFGAISAYSTGLPPIDCNHDSWFAQVADSSSRDAFRTLESFVRVFTSVSQMLESSYVLLHSSFRTVIGVAGQLQQLKQQLLRLLSAVTALRWLRRVVGFVARLVFGRRVGGTGGGAAGGRAHTVEWLWRDAVAAQPSDGAAAGNRWLIVAYVGVMLSAPYLMYRSSARARGQQSCRVDSGSGWVYGSGEHYVATCCHSFRGQGARELSMSAGERVLLAPRHLQNSGPDWVLASDGTSQGLVPANHVKIVRHVTPTQHAADEERGSVAEHPPP